MYHACRLHPTSPAARGRRGAVSKLLIMRSKIGAKRVQMTHFGLPLRVIKFITRLKIYHADVTSLVEQRSVHRQNDLRSALEASLEMAEKVLSHCNYNLQLTIQIWI